MPNIRQIAITVGDVTTAIAFYRDVLGLQFLFRPGDNLAFLAAGDIRIMLSTPRGAGQVGANSILCIRPRSRREPGGLDGGAALITRGLYRPSGIRSHNGALRGPGLPARPAALSDQPSGSGVPSTTSAPPL
jgi:catechol 2,3-dioxygenase-like lactoylglutathione lyase family enzyme